MIAPGRLPDVGSHGSAVAGLVLLLLLNAANALAVPSFARQSGMPCIACHTAFPQLNAFGREFKATGYQLSAHATRLPPLALMFQGAPGYTHTRKDQARDDLPPDSDSNDNVALNQASLFYAGRLLGPYASMVLPAEVATVVDHMGVMAQGSWDGVEDRFAIDNTEFRAADVAALSGHKLVYGAYVNNSPTMQDLWNSTPVWGFPFSGSGYAPSPVAAPMLAEGFAQQVVGAGAYAWLDNRGYVELGVYGSASAGAQRDLGVDPTGENEIDGAAPFWRLALESHWGSSNLAVGTFGMAADVFPRREKSAGHDHLIDAGVDAQYQYASLRHHVTLMGSSIYEHADRDASRSLGFASRRKTDLWETVITATWLYDLTYGLDLQYFTIDGDGDPLFYGSRTGSPDSNGIVVQIDYLPVNKGGGPSFWPASNVKISLQYTHYYRFDGSRYDFDGSGRDASDNDTVFLEVWLMM